MDDNMNKQDMQSTETNGIEEFTKKEPEYNENISEPVAEVEPTEGTEYDSQSAEIGDVEPSVENEPKVTPIDAMFSEYTPDPQGSMNMGMGNMNYAGGEPTGTPYSEKVVAKNERRAKRAAKKQAKQIQKATGASSHGIIFKSVSLVVSAAVFGVVALGTMYHTGDALGILNKESKTNTVVAVAKPENSIIETAGSSTANNIITNNIVDVSDIVEEVMPSIVAITSTTLVQNNGYTDWYSWYFGFGNNNGNNGNTYEQTGAGSGIIIGQSETELFVVTNNHVVEGADSLQVQFIDEESVEAKIKGTDSNRDLAVVSISLEDIPEETMKAIKIATLSTEKNTKVGQGVIAIGNALGYGQSVTTGVISAVDREVTIDNKKMTLIQTDAAINPGNSGGALLNTNGEVVGINSAKYSSDSVEGMGFAIPISSVSDIIEGLMNKEPMDKVDEEKKGYLNIYGRDVTQELSKELNAPMGVLVRDVMKDGAADKAGIEKLDIITSINGVTVTSMQELSEELSYYEYGEDVELTIQHSNNGSYEETTVTVTLGKNIE